MKTAYRLEESKGLEKIAHLDRFGLAFEVREDYRNVAAEFPDELAAGAAGRSECVCVGDNGDGVEAAFAFAESFENRDTFGADGETVGGIFYVAAAEDAAGGGAERGAYAEVGVGSVGVVASLLGDGDEVVVVGHGEIVAQR